MTFKRIGDSFVVRLEHGEEIVKSVTALCKSEGIKLATVSAIGAVDYAAFGLYDTAKKEYNKTEISEPLEMISLDGNITSKNGEPYIHFHASFADAQGMVHGGHLNEGRISATCELFIHLIYGSIGRKLDGDTELFILDI